jgi:hypothetical protein
MRVLLGSGGFRTEERIAFFAGQVRAFFGDVAPVLFVPYALRDHDGYLRAMIDKVVHAGYALGGCRLPLPHGVRLLAAGLRGRELWRWAGRGYTVPRRVGAALVLSVPLSAAWLLCWAWLA